MLEAAAGDRKATVAAAMAAVRLHFRPEFVNRIDDFIIFDALNVDQIRAIVRLQVWPRVHPSVFMQCIAPCDRHISSRPKTWW